MGLSRGQSTTTANHWPSFLNEGGSFTWQGVIHQLTVPVIPMSYIKRARLETDALKGVNFMTISLIADQAIEEINAITRLADRGRNGNTTIAKGKTHITDILEGDFLDGSGAPFQAAISKVDTEADSAFTDEVIPSLGATPFVIGDPNPNVNLAQNLVSGSSLKYRNRVKAVMFAKNYELERKAQIDAVQRGIDYSGEEVNNAEMVRRAGLYSREYRQSKLEDDYRKVIEKDSNAVRTLEILGNACRTLVGSHEAGTTPYHRPNPVMGILGGAATGYSVGGPTGAAIGGGLGLIASF